MYVRIYQIVANIANRLLLLGTLERIKFESLSVGKAGRKSLPSWNRKTVLVGRGVILIAAPAIFELQRILLLTPLLFFWRSLMLTMSELGAIYARSGTFRVGVIRLIRLRELASRSC
jgi:hypothetical protein